MIHPVVWYVKFITLNKRFFGGNPSFSLCFVVSLCFWIDVWLCFYASCVLSLKWVFVAWCFLVCFLNVWLWFCEVGVFAMFWVISGPAQASHTPLSNCGFLCFHLLSHFRESTSVHINEHGFSPPCITVLCFLISSRIFLERITGKKHNRSTILFPLRLLAYHSHLSTHVIKACSGMTFRLPPFSL